MTAPEQPDQAAQWVALARIRRPQGRRGEVFADILTDFPEKFADRRQLWLLADLEGGGGFNPRIKSAESKRALAPEGISPAPAPRRGRGRRKPAAAGSSPVAEAPVSEVFVPEAPVSEALVQEAFFPAPVFVPAPEPTPILLTADLVADMLTPSPRPRLTSASAKEEVLPAPDAAEPVKAKRGRPRKTPLAAPVLVADAELPPAASRRGPKAKAAKAQLEAEAPAAAPSKSRKK